MPERQNLGGDKSRETRGQDNHTGQEEREGDGRRRGRRKRKWAVRMDIKSDWV